MASRRYIITFLVASAGLYMALRVGIAGYCAFLISYQDFARGNRLVNVRILPPETVLSAIETTCIRLDIGPRTVIQLGDSQAYGYTRPPQETCAGMLNKRQELKDARFTTANLAIINGRFRDSIQILKAMSRLGQKAGCILLSSNPTHFVKTTPISPETIFNVPLRPSGSGVFTSLIFSNVFESPAFSWSNMRKGRPIDLFDELQPPHEAFVVSEVGQSYCANLDPHQALSDFIELVRIAKKSASRVVFYTQPRFYDDYLKPPYDYGWQPHPVDEAVLRAAHENGCDVVLDLADAFPRDHFNDLIHLSHKGHEALASLLLPHILATPVNGHTPILPK
jgi:hypothetical protein